MHRFLILLAPLTLAAPAAWAAGTTRSAPTAEQVRMEVRKAVEAHRAQERDDIRREEAEVGRRLTAAERAQLREQVRYQWLLPSKLLSGPSKVEGPVISTPPKAGAAGARSVSP
jgi:hypothetical protein